MCARWCLSARNAPRTWRPSRIASYVADEQVGHLPTGRETSADGARREDGPEVEARVEPAHLGGVAVGEREQAAPRVELSEDAGEAGVVLPGEAARRVAGEA